MTTTTVADNLPDEWPAEWRQAAAEGSCLHCGNELGRFWKAGDGPFCCRGCKGVYEMINQEDLCRFYDLKPGATAPAPLLRPESFDWLDRMLAEREESAPAGPLHLDLDIQGVHCAACVWLIEELFKRQKAGIQLRINPTLGKVELSWDTTRGDLKEFLAEVEKFGYRLGPSRKGGPRHSRALLMRMAISIAMAMNVMMFSLSFYFGLADGALYMFFGWLSLGMATVSLLAGGGIFLKGAAAGLRRGVLHLDVPISLGMILAYAGSTYGFLTGGPDHAYFDSLTIFIALMLVGRWAQENILERNRNSLLESSGAENITVKRVKGAQLEAVAASAIVRLDHRRIGTDRLPARREDRRRGLQRLASRIHRDGRGEIRGQPPAGPAAIHHGERRGFPSPVVAHHQHLVRERRSGRGTPRFRPVGRARPDHGPEGDHRHPGGDLPLRPGPGHTPGGRTDPLRATPPGCVRTQAEFSGEGPHRAEDPAG
jgi:copper chaperone CopZ